MTKTDRTFWDSLHGNEGLDTLEHTLAELFEMSDGTKKKYRFLPAKASLNRRMTAAVRKLSIL